MNIDAHSEIWQELERKLKQRRQGYVDRLITSEQNGDKLRGRIAEIDEILGLPQQKKPPLQPLVTY